MVDYVQHLAFYVHYRRPVRGNGNGLAVADPLLGNRVGSRLTLPHQVDGVRMAFGLYVPVSRGESRSQ